MMNLDLFHRSINYSHNDEDAPHLFTIYHHTTMCD